MTEMSEEDLAKVLTNVGGEGFVDSLMRSLDQTCRGPSSLLVVKVESDDLDFLKQRGVELVDHIKLHTTKRTITSLTPELLITYLIKKWVKEARW